MMRTDQTMHDAEFGGGEETARACVFLRDAPMDLMQLCREGRSDFPSSLLRRGRQAARGNVGGGYFCCRRSRWSRSDACRHTCREMRHASLLFILVLDGKCSTLNTLTGCSVVDREQLFSFPKEAQAPTFQLSPAELWPLGSLVCQRAAMPSRRSVNRSPA